MPRSSLDWDISIRTLDEKDLEGVLDVHMAAFPDSALTKLGREAVKRYYDWQLHGPHELVPLAAICGIELVGFSFGGVFRGATGGFLRKNRLFLILQVMSHPWLVWNPIFRERLALGLRVFRPRRKSAPDTSAGQDQPKASFGILSIAVHPSYQGRSIGKSLMLKSEEIAAIQGYVQMHLNVHPNNEQALHLYERLGWIRDVRGGAWLGRMTKSIPQSVLVPKSELDLP